MLLRRKQQKKEGDLMGRRQRAVPCHARQEVRPFFPLDLMMVRVPCVLCYALCAGEVVIFY